MTLTKTNAKRIIWAVLAVGLLLGLTPGASRSADGGGIVLPTTTRYVALPSSAFQPLSNMRYILVASPQFPWLTHGYGFNADPASASAPLLLPDGATITQLQAFVGDGSPEAGLNVTVQIRRHEFGVPFDIGAMASATTSGEPNDVTVTDSSISDAVIDNENYWYDVSFTAPHGTSCWCYGARVRYTISTLP